MLECQREKFALPAGEHYLNCGYLSPLSRRVEQAAMEALELLRNPSRITPDLFFDPVDEVRRAFAELIGARDYRRVAVLPSVSYGIAIAGRNAPIAKGHKVVAVHEQFPSNVYSWQRLVNQRGAQLVTVVRPSASPVSSRWTEAILDRIDRTTAVVAVPEVHWTDGTRFDLVEIGKRARSVGAWLVVDGSQSVGAVPFDVERVQPDVLVACGYKWLFGPYGISLGYFGPRLDDGEPLEETWIARHGSEDFSRLVSYSEKYQAGATRFDFGERASFVMIPMMREALRQVLDWTPHGIQQYASRIVASAADELAGLGLGIDSESDRYNHLFGLRLGPREDVQHVKSELARRRVHVSLRGEAIRVSVNVYNDASDLAELVDGLRTARSGNLS